MSAVNQCPTVVTKSDWLFFAISHLKNSIVYFHWVTMCIYAYMNYYSPKCAAANRLVIVLTGPKNPRIPLSTRFVTTSRNNTSAKPQFSNYLGQITSNQTGWRYNMAGKRDPFERTIFRDGNRASRLLEQTAGESVQKMSNSRDVTAEVIKDPRSAARRFKVGNLSPSMFYLTARSSF